jgi:hypothetical protein
MNAYAFGAIQTDNNEYVLPYKAEKNKNYKCIGCQQKLILKKGNIRKCHFAHYSETNCFYFEHPNESELHKEAKYKLASWLKQQKTIGIFWSCCKTKYNGNKCGNSTNEMGSTIEYEENDRVELEYRDTNNKYIADIAVINNNKVKYIFEIKNTHATITDVRPEPWFEIDALEIIKHEDIDEVDLTCIRNNKIRYCYNCRIVDEEWVNNLPRLYNKTDVYTQTGYGNQWCQENPCIKCGRGAYSPVFVKGYRQLCVICLCRYEEELKNEYHKPKPPPISDPKSGYKPKGLMIDLSTI